MPSPTEEGILETGTHTSRYTADQCCYSFCSPGEAPLGPPATNAALHLSYATCISQCLQPSSPIQQETQ